LKHVADFRCPDITLKRRFIESIVNRQIIADDFIVAYPTFALQEFDDAVLIQLLRIGLGSKIEPIGAGIRLARPFGNGHDDDAVLNLNIDFQTRLYRPNRVRTRERATLLTSAPTTRPLSSTPMKILPPEALAKAQTSEGNDLSAIFLNSTV
jgi:hypothetical protein